MKCHLCDKRIWFWQKFKRRILANAVIFAHFECWAMERIDTIDIMVGTNDDVIKGSKIRAEKALRRLKL